MPDNYDRTAMWIMNAISHMYIVCYFDIKLYSLNVFTENEGTLTKF